LESFSQLSCVPNNILGNFVFILEKMLLSVITELFYTFPKKGARIVVSVVFSGENVCACLRFRFDS